MFTASGARGDHLPTCGHHGHVARHATQLSTLPTARQGTAPKRTRKAKTFKLLNQIYRVIHLICTYLQKRTFVRRGRGRQVGSGLEPTDADSCEGRVCVKALVTSFDSAPVPGRTEQSGRALPETQLKDLYGGRPRRERARTAGGRGRPASARGPLRGPQAPLTTAGAADSHGPCHTPQVPPRALGHTNDHGPRCQPPVPPTPQATPVALGCPTRRQGPH